MATSLPSLLSRTANDVATLWEGGAPPTTTSDSPVLPHLRRREREERGKCFIFIYLIERGTNKFCFANWDVTSATPVIHTALGMYLTRYSLILGLPFLFLVTELRGDFKTYSGLVTINCIGSGSGSGSLSRWAEINSSYGVQEGDP